MEAKHGAGFLNQPTSKENIMLLRPRRSAGSELNSDMLRAIEELNASGDFLFFFDNVGHPMQKYLVHNACAERINLLLPECHKRYTFEVTLERFFECYMPTLDDEGAVSEASLPPLKGSEKQVAWAEKIRRAVREQNPNLLALLKITGAAYWIENHKGILYQSATKDEDD
jgi:hypothetical protein